MRRGEFFSLVGPRERLERAHRDLERRKEMIEMSDRLLRHDLGNDMQVITRIPMSSLKSTAD